MPEDPLEIEAARTAAQACWRAFPYLEQRYGSRGRLYADSDGAWLVTLGALDTQTAIRQVDWLGRILATRGMPTVILEDKLRQLATAYGTAFPHHPDRAVRFSSLADHLRDSRLKRIPQSIADSLARDLRQRLGEVCQHLPEVPQLLVAAVADEASGAEGAVAQLCDWLVEVERLTQESVDEVNLLLHQARRQTLEATS